MDTVVREGQTEEEGWVGVALDPTNGVVAATISEGGALMIWDVTNASRLCVCLPSYFTPDADTTTATASDPTTTASDTTPASEDWPLGAVAWVTPDPAPTPSSTSTKRGKKGKRGKNNKKKNKNNKSSPPPPPPLPTDLVVGVGKGVWRIPHTLNPAGVEATWNDLTSGKQSLIHTTPPTWKTPPSLFEDVVSGLAVDRRGDVVVVVDDADRVTLLALANGAPLSAWTPHPGNMVSSALFSAARGASSLIATGGFDCKLLVWDTDGPKSRPVVGKAITDFSPQEDDDDQGSGAMAFNPPYVMSLGTMGPFVFAALGDGSIAVTLFKTGALVHRFIGHTARAVCVAPVHVAPSGLKATWDVALVSASDDNTLRLFSARISTSPTSPLSPSDHTLATAENDQALLVIPHPHKIHWMDASLSPLGTVTIVVGDVGSAIRIYETPLPHDRT